MTFSPADRTDSKGAARTSTLGRIQNGNFTPAQIAALGCVVFGIMHILNLHPIGDGLWFWYAQLFRDGHKLYGEMHFNQQPFFVLVTAAIQSIFGLSWLASKIPALLELLLYVAGLYRISMYAPVRAWNRALLISAAFLLTLAISYARFDDYHYPTYITILFSALLLLRYHRTEQNRGEWVLAGLLGLLGGISLANRLNDGAVLVVAQLIVLPVFLRRRRLAAVTLFLLSVPSVLIAIVFCTGDTLRDWANDSIFRAAAIKGGSGTVLLAPLLFPFRELKFFLADRYQAIVAVLVVALVLLLTYSIQSAKREGTWRTRSAVSSFILFALLLSAASPWLRFNGLSINMGGMCMLASFVLIAWLMYRALKQFARGGLNSVSPLPLLLLLPFLQAVGAAMTSAKSPPDLTPAIGMMMIMLPVSLAIAPGLPESVLSAAAFLLTIYGLPMKIANPYQWHHYYSEPMFTDREWYKHPLYGPMYLETEQLRLMMDLCSRVNASGAATQLLSLPFPYPNYFCGVTPWQGHVQTWYDTASAVTVQNLTSDLRQHPPEWIAYERGLDTMRIHEYAFLGKGRLPHRDLDDLIANQVRSGAWSIALQRCYGGADWLLIHTRQASPDQPTETLLPSTDEINLCDRTEHTLKLP